MEDACGLKDRALELIYEEPASINWLVQTDNHVIT